MLRAYADEHVSDAIVRALRARGMDVVSVAQLGRQGTDDAVLLDQALAEERALLTCDADFLRIASERESSLPQSCSGPSNSAPLVKLFAR